MSKYPTIPDFTNAPESMAVSLRAVMGILETITGQRQGASLGAPSMFVQESAPVDKRGAVLRLGDLWIKPSTRVMSFWNGRDWTELA